MKRKNYTKQQIMTQLKRWNALLKESVAAYECDMSEDEFMYPITEVETQPVTTEYIDAVLKYMSKVKAKKAMLFNAIKNNLNVMKSKGQSIEVDPLSYVESFLDSSEIAYPKESDVKEIVSDPTDDEADPYAVSDDNAVRRKNDKDIEDIKAKEFDDGTELDADDDDIDAESRESDIIKHDTFAGMGRFRSLGNDADSNMYDESEEAWINEADASMCTTAADLVTCLKRNASVGSMDDQLVFLNKHKAVTLSDIYFKNGKCVIETV